MNIHPEVQRFINHSHKAKTKKEIYYDSINEGSIAFFEFKFDNLILKLVYRDSSFSVFGFYKRKFIFFKKELILNQRETDELLFEGKQLVARYYREREERNRESF